MRLGRHAAVAGFSGRYTRFITLIVSLGAVETWLWVRYLTRQGTVDGLNRAEALVALIAGATAVAALIAMKRTPLLSPAGNRVAASIATATHRAGHVVATWLDIPADVTGASLGESCRKPGHHRAATQMTLQFELSRLLGGVVAQELFAGELAATTASDLAWATALGADYVGRYGMAGSAVSLTVASRRRRAFLARVLDDPRTRKELEALLRDTKRDLARRMLQQRHVVIAVRDALLRKGSLTRDDVMHIIDTAEDRRETDAVLVDIRSPHERPGSPISVISEKRS